MPKSQFLVTAGDKSEGKQAETQNEGDDQTCSAVNQNNARYDVI